MHEGGRRHALGACSAQESGPLPPPGPPLRARGRSAHGDAHGRAGKRGLSKWAARLSGFPPGLNLLDHAHDVELLHDEELFAVDLHLCAGPLAEQDRRFLAHDLKDPSGYVVICFLGVLGLALFGVKF